MLNFPNIFGGWSRHAGLRCASICFLVWLCGFSAAAAQEDRPTDPSNAASSVHVDAAGAVLQRDGTLRLENGEALVLSGLDIGLGLVPATQGCLRALRLLQDGPGPWRVIGAERDRYDRLTGRIETASGEWVQQRLLRLGHARFAGGVSDLAERQALLAAEHAARVERRGVWGNRRFAIRPATMPEDIFNGFQIVEGRVLDVGRGDGVVFLNFGDDWREDFTAGVTVRLSKGDLVADTGEALSIYDLEGRFVRLRGIVRRYNGPFMEIAGADQIELTGGSQHDPIGFRLFRRRSADPSGLPPVSGSTL